MKTIIYSFIILLSSYFSWSQNDIASLEYYFDTDPGIGLATNLDIDPDVEMVDTNFSNPTSGLSEGTHKLVIRMIKQDGSTDLYM